MNSFPAPPRQAPSGNRWRRSGALYTALELIRTNSGRPGHRPSRPGRGRIEEFKPPVSFHFGLPSHPLRAGESLGPRYFLRRPRSKKRAGRGQGLRHHCAVSSGPGIAAFSVGHLRPAWPFALLRSVQELNVPVTRREASRTPQARGCDALALAACSRNVVSALSPKHDSACSRRAQDDAAATPR